MYSTWSKQQRRAEIFGAIKAELYIISHRYYDETMQGISTKQDTGGGLPEQTE